MAGHHHGYILLLAIIGFGQIKSIVSIEKPAETETTWPCPILEEFAPCLCSTDLEFHLNADCSQVKTESELATAFSARFSILTFNKLTIDHSLCDGDCLLTALSQTTFGPISFVEVDIQHTGIITVGESAFANSQHTLKSLILSNNQISSFTFQAIGEFEYLTHLNLQSNKFDATTPIPDIESGSLETLILSNNLGLTFSASLVTGCPKLKNLYLKGCEIPSVQMNVIDVNGIVYGLNEMSHIIFAGNSITDLGTASIDQGVEGTKTLGIVDFSGNSINSVSKNFVKGFGANGKLLLGNNAIERLNQDAWGEVFQELRDLDQGDGKIDLADNPLLCGCDMAWLAVTDRTLLNMITPESTCRDGVTKVIDLPEIAFEGCPLKMGKIN